MTGLVEQHTSRLRLVCAAFLFSTVVYGVVVFTTLPPEAPPLTQGMPLFWAFAVLALLNLVTVMPVYRVMLAAPRRVYAVSQEPEPLLASHLTAHVVAYARIEAVAVLGLLLFFLAGRGDWFWLFNGTAAAGMLLLWPLKEKVDALLGPAAGAGSVSAG